MPPPQNTRPQRLPPFVATNLQAYLDRYWAVMFSSASNAVDAARMRHYVNWYCTKFKTVDLDHHVAARRLIGDIRGAASKVVVGGGGVQLPILFVNKKCVGGMEQLLALEEQRKLKDVLQFGFEWSSGAKMCGPLPSAIGDTSLFLGKYSGAPVSKPVMQLPRMHPNVGGDGGTWR
jgi:glutaredoxin